MDPIIYKYCVDPRCDLSMFFPKKTHLSQKTLEQHIWNPIHPPLLFCCVSFQLAAIVAARPVAIPCNRGPFFDLVWAEAENN